MRFELTEGEFVAVFVFCLFIILPLIFVIKSWC